MKDLIIFHYHFLPGGVTDVVTSAVNSYLTYSSLISSITIVSGRSENIEKLKGKIHGKITFEICPSIDYREKLTEEVSSQSIIKELTENYASDNSIWWIHNYHLGKNPYFTKALIEISREKKQNMVFHIHDFPECSRYPLLNGLLQEINGDLYPQSDNIRYAVINSRDYNYLIDAGIKRTDVSLLENPMKTANLKHREKKIIWNKLSTGLSDSFPRWKSGEPYMLYPVRAIRRKNICEGALIAQLTDINLVVTLPGISDAEFSYSEKCRKIFTEGLAPGMFGIGKAIEDHAISFDELISGSSIILSSSVQEGFGYLFLNSMNWGKPLFAKDLDILETFKESFKDYPAFFYDCFTIPLESDDRLLLLNKYYEICEKLMDQLGSERSDILKEIFGEKLSSINVDFSYLTPDMQIKVLKKISKNEDFRNKCIEINIILIKKLKKLINSNISPSHKILEKNWSFESYCRKTEEIMKSFRKIEPEREHFTPIPPIYESMQRYFAVPEYLRLIYRD